MFTTHSLRQLSHYQDLKQVAENCIKTNRTAVIFGPPRSGGSILGQWLTQNVTLGNEKIASLYYQIGSDGGYEAVFRGVARRLTEEKLVLKDRDSVAQMLVKALIKEQCRLLYFDEAERASAEALRELFRLQDLAARSDHPFGIVLFAHRQPQDWLGVAELQHGKVRYHRVIPQLRAPEITSILQSWCPSLTGLTGRFDRNDRSVRSGVLQIEANGGNRIGVLEDFAGMIKGTFAGNSFGPQLVEAILHHTDSPVKGLPERIEQLELGLG